MVRAGFKLRYLVGAGVLLGLIGCLTPARRPVPPELAMATRDRIDLSAPPNAYARVDPELVTKLISHFAEMPAEPTGPKHNVLVLSGGGKFGAFAAGVLTGWSETGTRPRFDCVTGISTGALIAALAFIGPEYDETMRHLALTLKAERIYRTRRPISILWSASVVSSEPLENLINSKVDDAFLRAVAKGHAEGRRLYVGTTSLQARRLVVWDMGAIASRGDAEALRLFRTVLLASCSIPGFFPPVPIEVEIDGERYYELHVDGGASASLFLRLPELKSDQMQPCRRPLAGSNLYIIVSGKLYADPAPVRPAFLPVAGSSLTSVLYAQTRGDLYSLFTGSLVSGIRYHLTSIPQDFPVSSDSTSFDPDEMQKLYEEGERVGRSPHPWRSTPPGPEMHEQTVPRAGVRFATPRK